MYGVLLSLYLIVAIALIGFILLQHGKGASMGASFGAGASNTVFGSVGSGNFLTHSTAVLATLFFIISLAISALYARQDNNAGKVDFENLQEAADQVEVPTDKKADATLQVPAEKVNDVKATVEQKATEVKEAAEQKVSEVKEAAEQKAAEVKEAAEQKAAEVKEAAEQKVSEVKEAAEQKATEVKEAAEQKVSEVKEAVEQKAAEVTEAKETVEQAAAEAKAVTEQKATE